jgi:hypothetical protein
MDLNQRKLTKSEWESIEVPVSDNEKEVLSLICNGFHDVNIKYNNHISLFGYLKIEFSTLMEDYLYYTYFLSKIETMKKYNVSFEYETNIKSTPVIKKADTIRLQKNNVAKLLDDMNIYEYVLLDLAEKMLKNITNDQWYLHYFTLYKLLTANVLQINRHIISFIQKLLNQYESKLVMLDVIKNSTEFIEKNKLLLKYADMTLYEHQKELFTYTKINEPKLILYIAPTGTGKTMSPIGLSEGYFTNEIGEKENHKIIFVCAARHVGLALAKSSISIGKKIAFAFGCSSAADIRLHYYAAKEYTKHRKSGGIGKVDNSVGDKVEIMICDVKSYLPAMYYMMSFNKAQNIITYWDEPTITMDYESHELHETIKQNWRENLIPNLILSSATLPKIHEIENTIQSFHSKFENSKIYNIVSYDCKKSIPIINKFGYVIVPHLLSNDYLQIQQIVENLRENMTLLRYLDLNELIKFIVYISSKIKSSGLEDRFKNIGDITMSSIKLYYLDLLESIITNASGLWPKIYNSLNLKKERKILPNNEVDTKGVSIRKSNSLNSVVQAKEGSSLKRTQSMSSVKEEQQEEQTGIYITTKDAFTLTDGPTIFLTNEVEKIAKFYIQQSNIPSNVMNDILEKININNAINDKISILEQELELLTEKNSSSNEDMDNGKTKKKDTKVKLASDENTDGRNISRLENEIERFRNMIQSAQLNETFVPNKTLHLKKWFPSLKKCNPYTSDIDEQTIIEIMMLKDVDDSWKVLLLMGIGVFTNHPSIAYTEIIKKLANLQKLYMIIASSDYIYGTNYQFCHGYLSKNLSITQEKIIQAFGRIGRNNIQQEYTIRLRDDSQISKLFYKDLDKPEVKNMNILFC